MAEAIEFEVGGTFLRGHLWRPAEGEGPVPVVVLGHGLGAVQDMGLGGYAARFAEAGMAALTFDYRGFGESGGTPRQVIDVGRQLEDWAGAIAAARSLPGIDPGRVGLWGSSFAGGHVLEAARRDGSVQAVVSQCPFTDGPASAGKVQPLAVAQLFARSVADLAAERLGRDPITVPVYGPAGAAALLNAPDCDAGYAALVPEGSTFRNEAAARIVAQVLTYRPGRALTELRCPVLVCVCDQDSVAPAPVALRYAATCPTAEVLRLDCGHFDIYQEPWLDRAAGRQTEFLAEHLRA